MHSPKTLAYYRQEMEEISDCPEALTELRAEVANRFPNALFLDELDEQIAAAMHEEVAMRRLLRQARHQTTTTAGQKEADNG